MTDTLRIVLLTLPILLTCNLALAFRRNIGKSWATEEFDNLLEYKTGKDQYFAECKELALAHLASYDKERELKEKHEAQKRRTFEALDNALLALEKNRKGSQEVQLKYEDPRQALEAWKRSITAYMEGMRQLKREETARVKRLAEMDHRKYRSEEDAKAFLENVQGLVQLEREEDYEEDYEEWFAIFEARIEKHAAALDALRELGSKGYTPEIQHDEL